MPHILHAVKSNAYVLMQISEIWVSSVGLVDDSNRERLVMSAMVNKMGLYVYVNSLRRY